MPSKYTIGMPIISFPPLSPYASPVISSQTGLVRYLFQSPGVLLSAVIVTSAFLSPPTASTIPVLLPSLSVLSVTSADISSLSFMLFVLSGSFTSFCAGISTLYCTGFSPPVVIVTILSFPLIDSTPSLPFISIILRYVSITPVVISTLLFVLPSEPSVCIAPTAAKPSVSALIRCGFINVSSNPEAAVLSVSPKFK